jgi:hypothetical protein
MSLNYADQMQSTGKITVPATPVAETIVLGWVPRYIRAYNVNNLAAYEHFSGMAAGTSLDNANHGDTQNSLNAAGAITLTATGFTLGTDICDTAADVVYWLAIR